MDIFRCANFSAHSLQSQSGDGKRLKGKNKEAQRGKKFSSSLETQVVTENDKR